MRKGDATTGFLLPILSDIMPAGMSMTTLPAEVALTARLATAKLTPKEVTKAGIIGAISPTPRLSRVPGM